MRRISLNRAFLLCFLTFKGCPLGNAVKDFEPGNCLVSNPDGGAIMPEGQVHPLPGLISPGGLLRDEQGLKGRHMFPLYRPFWAAILVVIFSGACQPRQRICSPFGPEAYQVLSNVFASGNPSQRCRLGLQLRNFKTWSTKQLRQIPHRL